MVRLYWLYSLYLISILIILLFSIYDFILLDIIDSKCSFYELTKLPCPTCGLTRGFISISNGHIFDALSYNFIAVLLYIFLIIELFIGFFYLIYKKFIISGKIRLIIFNLILCLAFVRWIVLIITKSY